MTIISYALKHSGQEFGDFFKKKKKKEFGDLTHSLISHNFYHKIIIIEWTTFIIKFNLRGLFYNDCSLLP